MDDLEQVKNMRINGKARLEPAIVLCADTQGLGLFRVLGSMGIPIIAVYYDDKDIGYVSRFVKESLCAPHPEKQEDQFIDFLVNSASRFGCGLLIPSSDATLTTVSRHKTFLEDYFLVACTEWQITEMFINKKRTYDLAKQIGVPAPQTIVPHSFGDLERYANNIQFPCLVKPCQSHLYYDLFQKKMVKVHNFEQMYKAYKQATEVGLEVMLQEFIPGDAPQGVNYNSYFWNGEALVEFTARKVRNAPLETGSPCVLISEYIPEVIEPGRKILQAMGFYGYACIEFKKDPRDGVYKLIEVNGRHNLSMLLAVHCGINFPWIQYRHLVYGEIPSACDYMSGIYWIDVTRDVGYNLKAILGSKYSLI